MGGDPLTMGLMLGGGAMSALGSIQQGQDAKAWGKYQNKQAKADAFAQTQAAKVEQRKIREAASSQKSTAVSAISNAGLVVGDGTAADIESRITERGEYDAQMTMYNAQDQANRILAEGQAAKIQGNNQAQASYMQAAGSLLGAGVSGYSAWKSGSTPKTPKIDDRSTQAKSTRYLINGSKTFGFY